MVRRNTGCHQLVLCALVMLTGLVMAQPAFAQGRGLVQGLVKDIKGLPMEEAKVELEHIDLGRKYETKTNKKGEYSYFGLPSGAYKITVSKEILTSTRQVTVRQGTPATVNFFFEPANAAAGMAAEAAAKNAALEKLYNEAVQAEKAGDHDGAVAKFTEAAVLVPTCADCYYNIGMSEAAKKDYDKSEAAFKKAIEIKADHADAYNGLANIYNAQRKFDLAGAASAKATELTASAPGGMAGGNADSLYNQGVILWNSGKVAEAKKQFEAALAANPNHAESHYQMGMALINEGDMKGAAEKFNTYLTLAPMGPNAAQAKALVDQLPK